ncbi:alpha/beta fold hydrolase [Nocardia sp. NPDC101769]|uniref:alpha/beta fold hydrolase n=1 Tax=Nocardia sp. NPDC101769 TaxID=3364333 RepID=UPI0038233684
MLDHGPAHALAKCGYRVILPDLRGHGASARPHDPAAYPPDILADDGLTLIDHLELHDYDLGGYSLGARIVLRMLVRGARPVRAIVAGQGLAAVSWPATGGTNRRVLTALARGETITPGSPDALAAHWITHHGGDPKALLHVLNSLVSTPHTALRQIPTPHTGRGRRPRPRPRLCRRTRRPPARRAIRPRAGKPLDRTDRPGTHGSHQRLPRQPAEHARVIEIGCAEIVFNGNLVAANGIFSETMRLTTVAGDGVNASPRDAASRAVTQPLSLVERNSRGESSQA